MTDWRIIIVIENNLVNVAVGIFTGLFLFLYKDMINAGNIGYIVTYNKTYNQEVIIMRDIEVLEPYPNEILYSWLSRMFSWYGYRNNPKSNIREFNTILFGINSRSINNILIPHHLQELIQNINLNNSEYFITTEYLIKRTTIMPFYLAFLNESAQKKVIESLIHNEPINITKSILGLKNFNSLLPDYKLKFCYQCWLDCRNMYFNLEHQIINNNICYKHNTRLQYILINSHEYFLFDHSGIEKYKDSPYCISLNDSFLTCYIKIASIIHDIFIKGFKDEIVKLKSKIRMKMLSMRFMRSDFCFIDNFDEFWSNYTNFNVLDIDKKEIINVIYSNNNSPNPITYLTLIIFLFGSLNSYYGYNIDEQNVKIISQKSSKIISLTQPLKPSGLIYYNDLICRIYRNHYSIVRKVEKKYYEVKCSLCNHTWIIPQYYIGSGLIRCSKCKKREWSVDLKQKF